MSTVMPNPASVDMKDLLLLNTVEPLVSLVFGQNLFIGNEPATPDSCVTIFDTPGYPPDVHFDPLQSYYRPSIQVRVRSKDYLEAYTLISAIKSALHNLYITVNDTVYTLITCRQEPALLDWDANKRCRWVTTFDMQRRPGEGTQWASFADKTWDNIATW